MAMSMSMSTLQVSRYSLCRAYAHTARLRVAGCIELLMFPAKTKRLANAVLLLSQVCRRWASIKLTLGEHRVKTNLLVGKCWPSAVNGGPPLG